MFFYMIIYDLIDIKYICMRFANLVIYSTAIFFLIVGSIAEQIDYTEKVIQLKDKIADPNLDYRHSAYKNLAYMSDTFGPRLWGSDTLQKVILQVYKLAKKQKFQNVRLEAVKNFTKWVRGTQQLYLHSPRPVQTPLKVIGLGGTAPGYVKANAIVVADYDELDKMKDQVKGKIVVYNCIWKKTYGETVQYRVNGASKASRYGAAAALVRSVTPDSIQSVHTGSQRYDESFPKIPVGAITTQDADMLLRMQKRGQQIVLQLRFQSQSFPNAYSNNIVFQIVGSTYPEQILLMGGHIDSWDTGSQTGANDDAGGFLSCFEAMRLIKKQLPKPKRTIRFIAWSGQEWGGRLNGAHTYVLAHKQELKNHIVAFEDDLGSTQLLGFGYLGHDSGRQVVQSINDKYMGLIGADKLTDDGGAVDTTPLYNIGIPSMANQIADTPDHKYYFTYHHTAGDSMTMMNADQLDSNVLGIAVMFYILADLQQSIPKPQIKMDKLNEIIESIQRERKNII